MNSHFVIFLKYDNNKAPNKTFLDVLQIFLRPVLDLLQTKFNHHFIILTFDQMFCNNKRVKVKNVKSTIFIILIA